MAVCCEMHPYVSQSGWSWEGGGLGGLEVSEEEVEVDQAPICLFLHTDGRLGDKCGGTWSLSL